MQFIHALFGLAFFCLLSWLMSSERKRFPWRVVFWGLSLQLALAGLFLRTDLGQALFKRLAGFVQKLVSMAAPGAEMVFGPLADPVKMGAVFGPEHGYIFSFAGSGLVVIIFFSALMAILYHLGIMQVLVWLLAKVMSMLMGVSGAESMSMAANVFVGQTEAPLVVRPYISGMTNSELNAMMTGGFATIAGSVLAVYMGLLGPELGPHLLTASVMSAPAAFVIAKIMLPETQESRTGRSVQLRIQRTASNVVEAAANGTGDGLKLWLNVIAMLIAFIALVNLANWPLGTLGEWLEMSEPLTLAYLFGKVFAPIAWCMGVEGWHDCELFGTLLGTKVAVNEFVAFDIIFRMPPAGWGDVVLPLGADGSITAADKVAGAFAHTRSAAMAAYALCGFANFASVGIQLGGISPLAPERRGDLSRLALRAMLGGAFASWMTATVAGAFL
ncbi:MAG: NupC/NupG family nucleoside CNT transporter [Planctomycetes bacterium]|nr:NupC/NupG family nucleoside CNT transporter [Planctomycetota bacterium]